MPNFSMPGNPRYQPASLHPYFGYDNLAHPLVEVELAVMRTLADLGVIPQAEIDLLTPQVESRLRKITMSKVDDVERAVTKHDIRALVMLMQRAMPKKLGRWVHVPLTSYDVLDTARALTFVRAHQKVVRPEVRNIVRLMAARTREAADIVQVGRTHGQHALPITVGFWLASILQRVVANAQEMDRFADGLRGKISGAVGAYNAQVGLGFYEGRDGKTFEEMVLARLGLSPSPISTQILPPEPLAYYLFSAVMLSAALGQFGQDCRQLMRTEIREIADPRERDQVGSSTMAHKRNPINFENFAGMGVGNIAEFLKVLLTLTSEHQRDLVGSSIMRDFPTMVIRLVHQMETLLRPGKEDKRSFLERFTIDEEACARNLGMQGDVLLAEPYYLALQRAGYTDDAHHLVNERAMGIVRTDGLSLHEAMQRIFDTDQRARSAWRRVAQETKDMLRDPATYVGRAAQKSRDACGRADLYLAQTYHL